jgi:peptidoglycan/xylan/chitin deacetylase (PgdA/CDA1 family)
MAGYLMRFPEGKSKALTLSYDDGVEQDIRLVGIMDKFGLKGTFNLNSGLYAKDGTVHSPETIHRRMTARQADELFSCSGQEVAVHSLTHPFLEQLPPEMAAYEIIRDRENLEKQFGRIVRGMAYPFGTYSDKVVDILAVAGIAYARTTVSSGAFAIPRDWLRMAATCHHNDPDFSSLAQKFIRQTPPHTPWLFYLWGHSYEFDINNNWPVIEEFASLVGRKTDIWYATNIEIYDYIRAFSCVQASASGNLYHNPTALCLWFQYGNTMYSVAPGETISTTG